MGIVVVIGLYLYNFVEIFWCMCEVGVLLIGEDV